MAGLNPLGLPGGTSGSVGESSCGARRYRAGCRGQGVVELPVVVAGRPCGVRCALSARRAEVRVWADPGLFRPVRREYVPGVAGQTGVRRHPLAPATGLEQALVANLVMMSRRPRIGAGEHHRESGAVAGGHAGERPGRHRQSRAGHRLRGGRVSPVPLYTRPPLDRSRQPVTADGAPAAPPAWPPATAPLSRWCSPAPMRGRLDIVGPGPLPACSSPVAGARGSSNSRLPRDARHVLSPHRTKARVRPVRGLPPGAPRARTGRRRAVLRTTTGVRRHPLGTAASRAIAPRPRRNFPTLPLVRRATPGVEPSHGARLRRRTGPVS
ncbi:hypothetical protein SGLAM104S_04869 [Streptomyces glaucescens]